MSLNVTVTRRRRKYVTDLDAGRLRGLRGRRQADVTFFTRDAAADRAGASCSTPAPAWTSGCRPRRKRRSASPSGCSRRTRWRSSTSTARSASCRPSPTTRPRSRRRSAQTTANGSTSLYNAIYIALKELKKVKAATAEEIRRQAIVVLSDGDDTSSLVEFDEVLDLAKRSETAIYAIGLRPAEHRPARVQGSGVRAAAARAGNRRPRVLPDRRRPSCRRSTSRSPTSSRASTRSATRRRTRSATAPGAASSSASSGRALTARTKQGYFGPDRPLIVMNAGPARPLRRGGGRLRRCTSRGATPRVGRARHRRSSPPACSRTPSSSACRRWRPGTRRSSGRPRRSRRSSGCSASRTSTSR